MFEQVFKNVDDVLWKEAGCTTELDYIEQTSWLLFLKYLDALEEERKIEHDLHGKPYTYLLKKEFRWESWAAPKGKDGKIDLNKAQTGDDLRDFVNTKLFPYLHGFKQRASGPNTIEYKIGEIFGETKNKIQSGYNLREIIDQIDELRFGSQTQKHELSHLYEAKIRNMGNAGRNGGEYYTPRPLIRAIIQVVKPKIGERVYDGACGSAGFLCESFEYMKSPPGVAVPGNIPGNANPPIGGVAIPGNADLPIGGVAVPGNVPGNADLPAAAGLLIGAYKNGAHGNPAPKLTTKDWKTLQERTFFGKEKKSLA